MKNSLKLYPYAILAGFLVFALSMCKNNSQLIVVTLHPMVPSDSISVRWSPKGEKLALRPEGPGLTTTLELGPIGLTPVKLILSKSPESEYPDLLKGDWNRSGSIDDDSVIKIVPKESRGKMWSSFKAIIEIPVKDPYTGLQVVNPYPLDFWFVYDPLEPGADKVLRYSRRGWMEGDFIADTVRGRILITEMQMDGVYDTLDSWSLASPRNAKALYGSDSRPCTDHAWLGDRAFRIVSLDPSGRKAELVAYNPGVTREEELSARDQMAADRQAVRSGKSVGFLRDYTHALNQAREMNKPLLIDFETTWCGPCKQMDQWVYNADGVVEKALNLLAVKIDGDENRDLVKQYQVNAYPTIIMVGSDGREIKRAVGYQSVNQMIKFLSLE